MNVELREPRTAEEFDLYYDLRWRILRERWTQARESEKDEHEGDAIHIGAWSEGKLVGAGRVHFISSEEAQVRYMAVDEGCARLGIGSRILGELENRARGAGRTRMVLNSRESAVPFYRKHGYEVMDQTGTLFGTLLHWRMRKDL